MELNQTDSNACPPLFKEGAVVQLKCGGPAMVAGELVVVEEVRCIDCIWHARSGKLVSATIPETMLREF